MATREKTDQEGILDRLEQQYMGSVPDSAEGGSCFIKRRAYNPFITDKRRPIKLRAGTGSPLHNIQDRVVDTIKVPEKDRKEWVDGLDSTISELREFLIHDISTISMALEPAISAAQQTLNMMTDDSGVQASVGKIREVTSQLVVLKVIHKLADLLALDNRVRDKFLESWLGRQHAPPSGKAKPDTLTRLTKMMQEQKSE